jgi:Flp pilus assembly pilin Flp
MERIKRFLLDESGSSEAASSVILIAAVGMLLAAAIGIYYTAVNGFFTKVGGAIDGFGFGTF